jgi:hypothetical protein
VDKKTGRVEAASVKKRKCDSNFANNARKGRGGTAADLGKEGVYKKSIRKR